MTCVCLRCDRRLPTKVSSECSVKLNKVQNDIDEMKTDIGQLKIQVNKEEDQSQQASKDVEQLKKEKNDLIDKLEAMTISSSIRGLIIY